MAKKGNEEIKKAAKMILDSAKTSFKEGEANMKQLVKLLEKADSGKELEAAMKVIETNKKRMGAAFDTQIRILKVTMAQVAKSEKA